MVKDAYGLSRLPYPLSYVTKIEQYEDFDYVEGDPSNLNEDCNWFVISLTNDQLRKFFSALVAGADLIYPDEWHSVIIPFMQAQEFPNSVPEGSCMDLCALVADCIETSQETKNALNNFIQSNDGFLTPSDNLTAQNTPLINPTDCDLDEIWGNAVALWTSVNAKTIDLLEVIAEADNVLQVASDIVSAIPILNQLPVDEMLSLVADMGDWLLENYNAALTVELEQQIECDLFCIMQDTCSITFEQLLDYFSDYFTIDLGLYQLVEMVTWLTGIVPAGESFVYALNCFQIWVVGVAQPFFGVQNANFYAVQAQLGEPDNDWMFLCEDCVDSWEQIIILGTTEGSTLYSVDWGTNASVYVATVSHGTGQSLQITIDLPTSREITEVVIRDEGDLSGNAEQVKATLFLSASQVGVQSTGVSNTSPQDHTLTFSSVDSDQVVVYAQSGTTHVGSRAVSVVTLRGNGTNPFV